MIEWMKSLFKKQHVEPEAPLVLDNPVEDLDGVMNATIDEWVKRLETLPKSQSLDCWVERKNNVDGTTWIVRLQPKAPLYMKRR